MTKKAKGKSAKGLQLGIPRRNLKRFRSPFDGRDATSQPKQKYRVTKSTVKGETTTVSTLISKRHITASIHEDSKDTLNWVQSLVGRGKTLLNSVKASEVAFEKGLDDERRMEQLKTEYIEELLNENTELRSVECGIDSPENSGEQDDHYGTDTSYKNYEDTINDSFVVSEDEHWRQKSMSEKGEGSDVGEDIFSQSQDEEDVIIVLSDEDEEPPTAQLSKRESTNDHRESYMQSNTNVPHVTTAENDEDFSSNVELDMKELKDERGVEKEAVNSEDEYSDDEDLVTEDSDLGLEGESLEDEDLEDEDLEEEDLEEEEDEYVQNEKHDKKETFDNYMQNNSYQQEQANNEHSPILDQCKNKNDLEEDFNKEEEHEGYEYNGPANDIGGVKTCGADATKKEAEKTKESQQHVPANLFEYQLIANNAIVQRQDTVLENDVIDLASDVETTDNHRENYEQCELSSEGTHLTEKEREAQRTASTGSSEKDVFTNENSDEAAHEKKSCQKDEKQDEQNKVPDTISTKEAAENPKKVSNLEKREHSTIGKLTHAWENKGYAPKALLNKLFKSREKSIQNEFDDTTVSSVDDETIFHSFAEETKNIQEFSKEDEPVQISIPKMRVEDEITHDKPSLSVPNYQLVYPGSEYSVASYEDNEQVFQSSTDYVSPFTENPLELKESSENQRETLRHVLEAVGETLSSKEATPNSMNEGSAFNEDMISNDSQNDTKMPDTLKSAEPKGEEENIEKYFEVNATQSSMKEDRNQPHTASTGIDGNKKTDTYSEEEDGSVSNECSGDSDALVTAIEVQDEQSGASSSILEIPINVEDPVTPEPSTSVSNFNEDTNHEKFKATNADSQTEISTNNEEKLKNGISDNFGVYTQNTPAPGSREASVTKFENTASKVFGRHASVSTNKESEEFFSTQLTHSSNNSNIEPGDRRNVSTFLQSESSFVTALDNTFSGPPMHASIPAKRTLNTLINMSEDNEYTMAESTCLQEVQDTSTKSNDATSNELQLTNTSDRVSVLPVIRTRMHQNPPLNNGGYDTPLFQHSDEERDQRDEQEITEYVTAVLEKVRLPEVTEPDEIGSGTVNENIHVEEISSDKAQSVYETIQTEPAVLYSRSPEMVTVSKTMSVTSIITVGSKDIKSSDDESLYEDASCFKERPVVCEMAENDQTSDSGHTEEPYIEEKEKDTFFESLADITETIKESDEVNANIIVRTRSQMLIGDEKQGADIGVYEIEAKSIVNNQELPVSSKTESSSFQETPDLQSGNKEEFLTQQSITDSQKVKNGNNASVNLSMDSSSKLVLEKEEHLLPTSSTGKLGTPTSLGLEPSTEKPLSSPLRVLNSLISGVKKVSNVAVDFVKTIDIDQSEEDELSSEGSDESEEPAHENPDVDSQNSPRSSHMSFLSEPEKTCEDKNESPSELFQQPIVNSLEHENETSKTGLESLTSTENNKVKNSTENTFSLLDTGNFNSVLREEQPVGSEASLKLDLTSESEADAKSSISEVEDKSNPAKLDEHIDDGSVSESDLNAKSSLVSEILKFESLGDILLQKTEQDSQHRSEDESSDNADVSLVAENFIKVDEDPELFIDDSNEVNNTIYKSVSFRPELEANLTQQKPITKEEPKQQGTRSPKKTVKKTRRATRSRKRRITDDAPFTGANTGRRRKKKARLETKKRSLRFKK